MGFDTVRDDIFGRYEAIVDLVSRRFPDDSRGPDAFSYALELYLRALPNLDASVDGWRFLRVVEETPSALRAVGLSFVLPSGELPFDAEFKLSGRSIEYRILFGIDGDPWRSLSESQRWKAVYVYAADGAEPHWTWRRPVEGRLED